MTGPEASARSPIRFPVLVCIALVCVLSALCALGHLNQHHRVAVKATPTRPLAQAQQTKLLRALEAGRSAPCYDYVAEANVEPAPEPTIERFKLDHPVSIAGLLRDAGLEEPERNAWAQAFRSSAHWGILRPGHQVALYKDPETGRVEAFEYDLDDDSVIMTKAIGDGVVFSTRKTLTYRPQTVAFSLSLAQGLDIAAASKHLPSAVVEQIKDAYATRIPQLERGARSSWRTRNWSRPTAPITAIRIWRLASCNGASAVIARFPSMTSMAANICTTSRASPCNRSFCDFQ